MKHEFYIVELIKRGRNGSLETELKRFYTSQEGENYISKYILQRPANLAKIVLINRYNAVFTSI